MSPYNHMLVSVIFFLVASVSPLRQPEICLVYQQCLMVLVDVCPMISVLGIFGVFVCYYDAYMRNKNTYMYIHASCMRQHTHASCIQTSILFVPEAGQVAVCLAVFQL